MISWPERQIRNSFPVLLSKGWFSSWRILPSLYLGCIYLVLLVTQSELLMCSFTASNKRVAKTSPLHSWQHLKQQVFMLFQPQMEKWQLTGAVKGHHVPSPPAGPSPPREAPLTFGSSLGHSVQRLLQVGMREKRCCFQPTLITGAFQGCLFFFFNYPSVPLSPPPDSAL